MECLPTPGPQPDENTCTEGCPCPLCVDKDGVAVEYGQEYHDGCNTCQCEWSDKRSPGPSCQKAGCPSNFTRPVLTDLGCHRGNEGCLACMDDEPDPLGANGLDTTEDIYDSIGNSFDKIVG